MMSNTLLKKYTLSLMMTISLTFSTMPTAGMEKIEEKKMRTSHSTTPLVFTNIIDAIMHNAKICKLCNSHKYEDAFAIASPQQILAPEALIAEIELLEQYNFFRLCSLSMIYIHFAENEQLDQKKAIQHYLTSLKHIDIYLNSPEFGASFVSQDDSINNTVNSHRMIAYEKKLTASYNWAKLLMQPNLSDSETILLKSLLLSCVDCQKKHIDCLLQTHPNLKTTLPTAKFVLFNVYTTLIQLCDQTEGAPFLKEAKKIHNEFQSTNDKYHKAKTLQILNRLEKEKELDISVKIETASKKINEYRYKKNAELSSNLKEMGKTITTDLSAQHPHPLKYRIMQDHQRLFLRAQNNIKDEAILPLLREIENQIREELIKPNVQPTLFDVYQQYEVFLGGDALRKDITSHILPAFLQSGDIEGALERVVILAQLEYQKLGNNSNLTLCLRAAIKNLNGDHEEWEAFEQKMAATWENIQKEKEATRNRKEQEYAAMIRDRKILLPSKPNNNKQEKKPQQHAIHSKEEKLPLSPDQETSYDPLMTSLPLKEEKKEKKKRHAEAEKQREAQKNESASITLNEKKPQDTISTASQSSIENVLPTIKDLYLLTSVAKDVDSEIENNTWTFSREDLMMYFEALGCTATDGGKHKKVSLPKAAFVFYEGSTIAIMNDLGGALTLPRWDGSEGNGQVPSYLRKQILKAREKLVLLKLKANNTTNSIITNSK